MEAFVARFHDYAVRVTAEQVNVVRPLRHESANQFVLRWLDARLLSTPAQSEARMVRDCISALGNLYPPASSSVMPVTERELLLALAKQAETTVTSNMVNASYEPGTEQSPQSLATLRSGRATAGNKGKTTLDQSSTPQHQADMPLTQETVPPSVHDFYR